MNKFSFFKAPITNLNPCESITLTEFHKRVKNDIYKPQIEKIRATYKAVLKKTNSEKKAKESINLLKTKLDYITVTGIFKSRKMPVLEQLEGLSFYTQIDLDGLTPEQIKQIQETPDNYLFFRMMSPSGNGLKLFYRFPESTTPEDYHLRYESLLQRVESLYGVKPDSSCKDIGRATFTSYDPDCFINLKAVNYAQKQILETQEQPQKEIDESRSGKEWRELLKLIKAGKKKDDLDKDYIFNEMNFYSKWKNSTEAYREHTWKKAFVQIQKKQELDTPKKEENKPKEKITTEVLDILQNPDFYGLIDTEFEKMIEGEETPRKIIFFVFNMRNVANLTKATDNLMVNDEAGTGKDFVVNAVFKILPDAEKDKRVRISPKVLAYSNDEKNNPEGWIKKCLYLEDVPNTVLNDDAFKVMSSADSNGVSKTSVIINGLLKDINIRGKPSIILTIAQASPKQELLRRYPILNLDSGIDQTKAIIMKQSQFAESGEIQSFNPEIKKAISKLKRIKVKIPFASKIGRNFPSGNVIIRTHFPRFLDYIKSSCALYQYQRKRDETGEYIAIEQDYEIAREMITATTSNQLMIPLTKIQKRILDEFAKLEVKTLEDDKKYSFEELFVVMQNISGERWLRIQLDRLVEFGFLSKSEEKKEDSIKPIKVYSFNDVLKLELPSFKDLDSYTNNTTTTNNTNNTNHAKRVEDVSPSNLHVLHDLHSEFKYQDLPMLKKTDFPIVLISCSRCDGDTAENRLFRNKSYCPICLEEEMKNGKR